ncbi:MAG: Asp-tRNA(Asn)/Glu-tRNA(Gln) amidotransferase subunit GatB [Saprospiraceae bacterium]|nr:Asp-tRNA(Asn)/Glu-tRNA(Gln) amidotransferase subunit GatB [Saprospiraceae bacterium]
MESTDSYEIVIGLEVHVQLATKSKAFCGDPNLFGAAPNSQVSVISLGHPGTLPRINEAQIEAGIKLGLALGSTFPDTVSFDRKNYFYTDLPKGYQITQDRAPLCQGGYLPIRLGDQLKKIRIHHVHLEEDAGKSIHDQLEAHSLIDLNRAGVPLLEIVTEPDLRSGEEVDAFMTAVRQLVRYLEISDGHMEQGSLRCDVNVSVRKKDNPQYGERCEVKNLNSMKFARQAIAFESKRQISLLESGKPVISQTRQFHPENGSTSLLRSKEEAPDYRYFPEPDMPPVKLHAEQIDTLRVQQVALPWDLYTEFQKCGLSAEAARQLSESRHVAAYFQACLDATDAPVNLANILIQRILPEFPDLEGYPLQAAQLCALEAVVSSKEITAAAAFQNLLPAWVQAPEKKLSELIDQLELKSDAPLRELEGILRKVVAGHPKEALLYRNGNTKLFGFFMGKAMRETGKKADPQTITALLKAILEA